MRAAGDRPQGSLATRLVGLFTLGAALVFLLLGSSLTLMLRGELRARDMEEIDGKTAVVEHHLAEVRTHEDLSSVLPRFADTAVGHAHLQLGLMVAGRWLLRPGDGVAELLATRTIVALPDGHSYEAMRDGTRTWWVRRVSRPVADAPGGAAHAIVAVDVTHAQRVLDRFNVALLVIGATGILLMAALAWWSVRRGLGPLQAVAADAQRVTAERLGEPLAIEEAPEEVRGVVAAINTMMSRLDESFRSLERFSADIAHELRTPLNSLMLRVEVTLARERASAEYREALVGTMQELEQLHRMVSDMLFIARAERGMSQIRAEPVDLRAETLEIVEYFDALAAERGLVTNISGEASVNGDRHMIRRAITNLVSNAVRYAPERSGIEIAFAVRPDRTVLSVWNRCAPLSREQIDHLFARFARGEGARNEQPEGAGLGLAIVRSIMKLHDGVASATMRDGGLLVELAWISERDSHGEHPPASESADQPGR